MSDMDNLVNGVFPDGYRCHDYGDNPYYRPDLWGCERVADIELSTPDWSYDTLSVLRRDDGYYIGTDSGCSCPTPFETYFSLGDYTGPLTREQCIEECISLWSGSAVSDYLTNGNLYARQDMLDLIESLVGDDEGLANAMRDRVADVERRCAEEAERYQNELNDDEGNSPVDE